MKNEEKEDEILYEAISALCEFFDYEREKLVKDIAEKVTFLNSLERKMDALQKAHRWFFQLKALKDHNISILHKDSDLSTPSKNK